jgi:predicted acyltransferase
MVIVNNPGDWDTVYPPLLHAEWNGWTPTDLIFPFFLFIVGVSMAVADRSRVTWAHALRRGAVIIGLGLLLAGFPFFGMGHAWRVPGVLQRIGACYLLAFALARAAGAGGSARTNQRLAAMTVAGLLVYWALQTLVPVPGGVAGDLREGRDLGAWLDRTLLGGHLWRATWDPEGVLSTLPAAMSTITGVIAGRWLRERPPRDAIRGLLVAALAGVIAGLLWATVFPINKSLWTSSYVCFTSGIASALLAVTYWLFDLRPTAATLTVAEPFVALGRNALLLFVLSGLGVKTLISVKWPDPSMSAARWIYVNAFAPLAGPYNASLLYALANLAVLGALMWALHRRQLYLRA